MKIVIVENNLITSYGENTELFPNVSFSVQGLEENWCLENNVKQVISDKPYSSTEKLVYVLPYLENDIVYDVLVVQKTSEDISHELDLKSSSIRATRNNLLSQSDWTQVLDAPVDKTAWATYRQALRDITQQEGFPFNVVFPNPPL